MTKYSVPQPLSDVLANYCNVNAPSINDLASDLKKSVQPEMAKIFRQQLAFAIKYQSITLEQYEDLKGEDFDSQDELKQWLQTLWNEVFES